MTGTPPRSSIAHSIRVQPIQIPAKNTPSLSPIPKSSRSRSPIPKSPHSRSHSRSRSRSRKLGARARSRQMSVRTHKLEALSQQDSQPNVTRAGSSHGVVNAEGRKYIRRDLTHPEFIDVFHTSANKHSSICVCFPFITGCYVIMGFSFIANVGLCVALLIQFILDVSSIIVLTGVILLSVSVIGLFSGWYGIRTAHYNFISLLMITMIGEGLLGAVWIIVNFMINSTVPIAAVISFLVFCVINLYLASYILDLCKWLDMLNEQLLVFKKVEVEDEPEKPELANSLNVYSHVTLNTMDSIDTFGAGMQLSYIESNKKSGV